MLIAKLVPRGCALVAGLVLLGVAGCGAHHSVSSAHGSIGAPAWSTDGTRIAWSEVTRHAGARIWIANADMSHPRAISPPIDALGPIDWLPGTLVYWANSRLFSLKPGGKSSLITLFGGDSNFSIDGQAVRIATGDPACSSGCNGGVLVMTINGTIVRRISRNTQSTYPSLSPDGIKVAFARNLCDTTGRCERPAGIWVATIANGRLTHVARTGACPSWSPSGAAIAYLGFNPLGKSSLRIVPASGGVSTLLVRRAGIGCPSWSHDSRTLAAVDSRTGKLLVVDPATHAARAVAPNVLHEVIDFAWSPDASELLVIARPTPRSCSSLWLVAATTGKARLLRSCS